MAVGAANDSPCCHCRDHSFYLSLRQETLTREGVAMNRWISITSAIFFAVVVCVDAYFYGVEKLGQYFTDSASADIVIVTGAAVIATQATLLLLSFFHFLLEETLFLGREGGIYGKNNKI